MTRRLLSFLTALVLTLNLLCTCLSTGLADDDASNLKYTVSGGKVTITGYYTAPEGELNIPSEIDGKPVTAVGDGAFSECAGITSVFMPSVEHIGEMAFYWCSSIEKIDMPSATSAEYNAFADCTALTEINAPMLESTGSWTFFMCSALENAHFPSLNYVGYEAFADDSALVSLNLENAQTVSDGAFARCTKLESINLSGLNSIGENAFEHCSSLNEIIISDENDKFSAQDGMLLSKDGKTLYAYPGAKGSVRLPENVEIVEPRAFYYSDVEEIDMPYVKSIGDNAFLLCKNLKSVLMPYAENIGQWAFNCCNSLTEIDLQSAKVIGQWAFADGNKALSAAYFYGDAPSEFGDYVFYGHTDDFSVYYAKDSNGFTTPVWNEYPAEEFTPILVSFFDSLTNTLIEDRLTHEGGTVSAPAVPLHEGYTFIGWDKDFSCVTEGMFITALYESTAPTPTPTPSEEPTPTPTPSDEPTPTPTEEPTPTPSEEPTPTPSEEPTPTPSEEPTPTPTDEPTPTPSDEPTPTPTDEPTSEPTTVPVTIGDVNEDDKVNTADAVIVLKYAAGMLQLEGIRFTAADVNSDGIVNTADAVMILKFAAGMITQF